MLHNQLDYNSWRDKNCNACVKQVDCQEEIDLEKAAAYDGKIKDKTYNLVVKNGSVTECQNRERRLKVVRG